MGQALPREITRGWPSAASLADTCLLLRYAVVCILTSVLASPFHGHALEPDQIFEKASPSVVLVEVFGKTGAMIGSGSGVVIAPGEVITNCHVVVAGVKWRVRREGHAAPAYIRFYDDERDLCQLLARDATSFTRPIRGMVAIDDLRVGQRVYAIGAPRGLELTLTEGIVSQLRQSENGAIRLIQTSAAVSPGSSGGGLFDQEGRLVGITTFILKESQNLNFAVPASWVLELPSRQADLVEEARKQRATGAAEDLRRKEEELRRREEQVRGGEEARKAEPPEPQSHYEPKQQAEYEARFDPLTPLPTPPKLKRGDEDAAIRRFQSDMVRIVGKVVSERDYPRLARDRYWQGSTMVRVEVGPDGLLKGVTVTKSSGFSVLDDRAVSRIREISLPIIPDELRERTFSVDVPFKFSLKNREQQ